MGETNMLLIENRKQTLKDMLKKKKNFDIKPNKNQSKHLTGIKQNT